MKRLVAVSAALALAGALAPWNGTAGASTTPERGAPAHRLDLMIKLKGSGDWVGADDYGRPKTQQLTAVIREAPGRVVAVVRVVNTGSEPTEVDIWGTSIRYSFYGGSDEWPDVEELAPGESVQFRWIGHRGTAKAGDSYPMDFTARFDDGTASYDGVRLLLKAKGRG